METYGDLKKAINLIQLGKKGAKVGNLAIDAALGAIPGVGAAKSTFDFIKAAFLKPDTKKTSSWLDKLDIDDEMEAIVDDTVEDGFLKMQAKVFDSEPDDKPLEDDFNMNQKMVDYLSTNYDGRKIAGIKEEEKMRNRFQKLAGINEIDPAPVTPTTKQDSSVVTISKDLDDQGSNFKNIQTKEKMVQLLDAVIDKLDPTFKETPAFKQAVIAFYNNYK
jgi:hypothetical protein